MPHTYAMRCGVTLTRSVTGLTLDTGANRLPLKDALSAAVAEALSGGERTMPELVAGTGHDGDAVAAVVDGFDQLGLIRHAVAVAGGELLDLEPMTARPSWWPTAPARTSPDGRGGVPHSATLSRFAYARSVDGLLIVESPLSHYRATVRAPETAALIMLLASGVTGTRELSRCGRAADTEADTTEAGTDTGTEAMAACLHLLVHAGLAVCRPRGSGGAHQGSDAPEFTGWSFHDLLFHSRSRQGVHDQPIGRLYPLRGRQPPLPAAPAPRGERIALDPVDLEQFGNTGPSFSTVLESRRSVRHHGSPPLSRRELGDFLFRCARIRRVIPADPEAGIHYQSSDRPYPSGGGAYELEIYPVIGECRGLGPGIYHYAADAHALEHVAGAGRSTEALLADAALAAAMTGRPQVLLAITARFARVSWKYSGMAYATVLKNVGVLYQTMYLVATAMGLAPCAIGTGNSARLPGVLNLPYGEESMVGEFLLGASGQAGNSTTI